ncbi:thioesterase II family protein [Streptomyces bauhiniae]|uniref:thioesterase II family protein n=1 Tax=Streptomyces bauhiniae TaxID=2340725 RepID=UPI0038290D55
MVSETKIEPSPERSGDGELWFRRFHPEAGPRPGLVCFPHAGGSAAYWYPLSAALRGRADVLAVQYPGRQERRREPLPVSIDDLADGIVDAWLPPVEPPFVFFGHSMGAIVAFEVARRLHAQGRPGPQALVVSGRRAPSRQRVERVHLRDDPGLVEELRSLGGSQQGVLTDPELLSLVLPAVRADYRAIETYTYRPGPRLTCPVTALVGDADPKASVEEADAWREHTTAGFDLRVFSGGHFYLTEHQDQVTARLAAVLGV